MKCACGNELATDDTDGMCAVCRANGNCISIDMRDVYGRENYGWVCPKCGSVWAPSVIECGNCNRVTITTATSSKG